MSSQLEVVHGRLPNYLQVYLYSVYLYCSSRVDTPVTVRQLTVTSTNGACLTYGSTRHPAGPGRTGAEQGGVPWPCLGRRSVTAAAAALTSSSSLSFCIICRRLRCRRTPHNFNPGSCFQFTRSSRPHHTKHFEPR